MQAWKWVVIGLLGLISQSVGARDRDGIMTFETGCLHDNPHPCIPVLQADGAIFGKDTLDRFDEYMKTHPNPPRWVSLNSIGGNASLSMILGKSLRILGMNTIVEQGNVCQSACVYLFLGGVQRTLEPKTELAVHTGFQIHIDSSANQYDDVRARFSIGQLLSYLREMHIDPRFTYLVFNSLDSRILFHIPMTCSEYLRLDNTTSHSELYKDPCEYLNYPLKAPTQYVSAEMRAYIRQQSNRIQDAPEVVAMPETTSSRTSASKQH